MLRTPVKPRVVIKIPADDLPVLHGIHGHLAQQEPLAGWLVRDVVFDPDSKLLPPNIFRSPPVMDTLRRCLAKE
jgi:hypothetical protein